MSEHPTEIPGWGLKDLAKAIENLRYDKGVIDEYEEHPEIVLIEEIK